MEMSELGGPIGGLLAAAFGTGCVSGWGFAMKLMTARINDLRDECKRRDELHAQHLADANARITAMDARLAELDDFLIKGMKNQLSQVRSSTNAMIERGKIK